jgi:hypothetical protein
MRAALCTAVIGAALCFVGLRVAPGQAAGRGDIHIRAGEDGGVVLRVTGTGRPPERAPNAAQARAAAHNAAEIDAYGRVAYLLGRVERRRGRDGFVATFRERFTGIHVENYEQLEDGTVRAEVSIAVPATQVPELLERIDEYIRELDAEVERLRLLRP